MFNIFYKGMAPNIYAHEQSCKTVEEAAERSATRFFWFLDGANDYSEFDFTWMPDKWEEDYLQVFPSQWQRNSGTYFGKKETAVKREYYFRSKDSDWGRLVRKIDIEHWDIPKDVHRASVDTSWHPDSLDIPYIYRFPSHFQRSTSVRYKVPGATSDKFIDPFEIKYEPSKDNWIIPNSVKRSSIDFGWRPDYDSPPFNYHFASRYNRSSGVIYRTPGATSDKFIDPFEIKYEPSKDNWIIPDNCEEDSIDFEWRPDPSDQSYIYHFSSKYQRSSGVIYKVPGATSDKFIDPFTIRHKEDETHWTIPSDVDRSSIDFSWLPDLLSPPFEYHFATRYQKSSGVVYTVASATSRKFISPFQIRLFPSDGNWIIPEGSDPDLTWRPDSLSQPYNYKFPSNWARESGLEYRVPGATQDKFIDDIRVSFSNNLPQYYIETSIDNLVEKHPNETFWALNKEMNYDGFDFGWRPDASQLDYYHVFGSQWQVHSQTYFISPTSRDSPPRLNFIGEQQVRANSGIGIYFIDKYNADSKQRYEDLKARYENVVKVRYVESIFSTIRRCTKSDRSGLVRRCWIVSSENDYSDFDFDWHAEPWQDYMFHVFGSQWQKWSDTYLINLNTYNEHMRWCKDLKDMPDLHFVEDQKVKALNVQDIYMIDFGNQHNILGSAHHDKRGFVHKTTRFNESYLAVLRRIVSASDSEYLWVISSVCDYSDFDFDWCPEPYQDKMLHVFKSSGAVSTNGCDFGDTFYVHVPTFKKSIASLELLEWFDTVHYCDEQIVPRYQMDMIPYEGDDLTTVVKQHDFNMPYAVFYPKDMDISLLDYTPSLWNLKHRSIHVFTESGSVIVCPRDFLKYLGVQMYDYPEIMRHKGHFLPEKPLNIVFISNGEVQAEQWYDHLINITKHDPSLIVKRVKNVKGRANAYKAAAKASDTTWFFTVFGKLEVSSDFDWHWQPDRLQEPKHYIFNAYNPVTKLEYGHMGMIAYNKKLVLETNDWGLDFTLSRAHEVVPLLSGVAHYNTDPISTWRTAFREVIKLINQPDEDSIVRLNGWLSSGNGKNGEWSVKGANDARDYFLQYKDSKDYTERMMKSFEWEWLDNLFQQLYP